MWRGSMCSSPLAFFSALVGMGTQRHAILKGGRRIQQYGFTTQNLVTRSLG
jgi:hypothetical protein